MKTSVISLMLVMLVLSGCYQAQPKVRPAPAPVKPVVQAPPKVDPRQVHIQQMLNLGEYYLSHDRLTTPPYGNALEVFRSVLLLEPGNAQARSGIQSIIVRYVQLARQELAHSKPSTAMEYARKAATIEPGNPLSRELDDEIRRMQTEMKQQAAIGGGSNYPIPLGPLGSRNATALPMLKELADRVKNSDEILVITARNDEEGRWLYQQLRLAADGYRIRGDIQVGPQPSIVVQTPIN